MSILQLQRHWKTPPQVLANFRDFNTEKISSFSFYKTPRYTVIELFFTTGKWDVLSSTDWDDESFSNFLRELTQNCHRRN